MSAEHEQLVTVECAARSALDKLREADAAQGLAPPRAVHSRQEATEIISAMRDGSYDAARFVPDADLPEALRPS